MKKFLFFVIIISLIFSGVMLNLADVALSAAADRFQVSRRIVFYNDITGDYILVIEGKCSLGNNDAARSLSVTCRTGENTYKKYFLGLSYNVTYFSEQIDPVAVNDFQYKVFFRPTTIVPDMQLQTP